MLIQDIITKITDKHVFEFTESLYNIAFRFVYLDFEFEYNITDTKVGYQQKTAAMVKHADTGSDSLQMIPENRANRKII